jgi:hypothetical protein
MKIYAFTLTLLVAFAICMPALAQGSNTPPPEPQILTDEQGEYPMSLHQVILEAPSEKLTVVVLSGLIIDLRIGSLIDSR